MSDLGKAKIRDARMTGAIHKDVHLVGCQHGGESGFNTIAYPFKIPMDHIAGVKVVKAVGNVG